MTQTLSETLTLERLEINLFRGRSPDEPGVNRIFGGQVIAQALTAAYQTVEERVCHSLHCYFIRPGDPSIPIIFEVDRSRDGRSFTTRRVVAIQHGRQIFNFSASFQDVEKGLEHQTPMTQSGAPESYPEMIDMMGEPEARAFRARRWPIEWRFVDPPVGNNEGAHFEPRQRAWFRVTETLADDPRLHQAALAYVSDIGLLGTAIRAHGMPWAAPKLQSASLDHAMWFHRPSNPNQWHLYEMDSPSSSGARGFNRGAIFREDGALAASTAQEGLMRQRTEAP